MTERIRFLLRRLARRVDLRAQAGSMLIEVMVGAILVVVTSAAILDGLGGAQDTGQRNKARSISASLAQEDQERLRALPIEDLANFHQSRQVKVNTAPYTVDSRADWVRDSSGVVSCTNDSTQAQYLRISSTVTSNVQQNPPVTETSLVAPPRGTFDSDTGTAAVQVVDRDGNPIAGVRVDIDGPDSLSDTTNDQGCVVFGFIHEGPWNVSVSSLGLIGWDGNSPYKSSVGVVAGTTVLKKVELDEPSSINATFQTKGTTDVAPVSATSQSLAVSNAKLPAPGWKSFSASPAANSITATTLYPFKDGYGAYAGSCDSANPTQWDSDYFTTTPTGAAAFVVPTPGQASNVVVRMPAINVVVKDGANVLQNARVFVTNADTDCDETYASQLTNALGAMPNPGFPWGKYNICADNGANRKAVLNGVANTDPNGTAPQTMALGAVGTGKCAP
jgi:type II secretory pathway pseudopilin PulG